jgi:hypothetical protein
MFSATPDGAYVIDGPWAGLCVRAEVMYRLSRWVKGPAERLQYPISNRAPVASQVGWKSRTGVGSQQS